MKRTAFFISDGTGLTAEALGHSLLAQFEKIEFERITVPYIDDADKAREMVKRINKAEEIDGMRPLVFDTIVNSDIRDVIAGANGFMVDIFGTFLNPLEQELQSSSSYTVGKSHAINNEGSYERRIHAVNFALDNDDGARTRHYDEADLILVGASRSGKTPIRNERRPNSRYSSMKQCMHEIEEIELMYRRERIPYLNTTAYSVEEISTRIMVSTGLKRNR